MNMKRQHVQILMGISIAALMAGCGRLDSMQEAAEGANKNTEEVSKKLDKQLGITENLNKQTESLQAATLDLYSDLRQKETSASREQYLAGLKAASNFEEKIGKAAKYMMALEAQLWRGHLRDTTQKLDVLREAAFAEMFTALSSSFPVLGTYDISLKSMGTAGDMNIGALGIALHRLNRNIVVEDLVKEGASEAEARQSMFVLLAEALRHSEAAEADLNALNGKPAYIRTVLEHTHRAVRLLKLRANYATWIAIQRMNPELAALVARNAAKPGATMKIQGLVDERGNPLRTEGGEAMTLNLEQYMGYLVKRYQWIPQFNGLKVPQLQQTVGLMTQIAKKTQLALLANGTPEDMGAVFAGEINLLINTMAQPVVAETAKPARKQLIQAAGQAMDALQKDAE